MKESAPLDGSEGIAGAGGGQGQVADKKMTAQASPPGCSMPHPHQALQEA